MKKVTSPPVFGIVFAISAKAFPAFAAPTTAPSSTFLTVLENNTIAAPNGTSCNAKLVRLLSPLKSDISPPVFGTVFAISAKAFPALAAPTTASSSTFLTVLENKAMAAPKGIRSSANVARSLSPEKKDIKPPVFGIVLAISVNTFPALAAAVIALSSILPATVLENSAMAFPNGIRSSANVARSLSPAKSDTRPPVLGMVSAISDMTLPALAAAVIAPSSIFPETVLENSVIAFPNGIS